MTQQIKKIVFVLFFLSGFCGLLYQIVWVRLAYASFGTITPVLSVIIAIFMLGLAAGSYLGGKWITPVVDRYQISPLVFYAIAEFFIAAGALAVPALFAAGERVLFAAGDMNSMRYLVLSNGIMALSVLPWCVCMGVTYPFMMAFLQKLNRQDASGFSYLYLGNLAGAACGALLTAWVLIELAGFYKTLLLAASLNLFTGVAALAVCRVCRGIVFAAGHATRNHDAQPAERNAAPEKTSFVYAMLFATGFVSMAMEVIWIRAFTPVLTTTVYAFASLLTVYLLATGAGSFIYRFHLKRNNVFRTVDLVAALAIFSFLPVIINDPRYVISIFFVLASIVPLCAALGYLTPKLIDEYSRGKPSEGGRAYALNIAGCVLGPLFASYVLLPLFGVKAALVLLGLPFLLCLVFYFGAQVMKNKRLMTLSAAAALMAFAGMFISASYEDGMICYDDAGERKDFSVLAREGLVRRDHTATVISTGEGIHKMLLVNGIGITHLTPITKMMAHLPLALMQDKPTSALVLCLGMGTTYRSALSWDIRVTAVELVPSVKKAMGYYFEDAEALMRHPGSGIVIDDGRRFLNRTTASFDVITIDPPPPVESAGSSLLYSEEFYALVKRHLSENGILQQWFPCGEFKIAQAAARALSNVFAHVRVYRSVEGWGLHCFASMHPIDVPSGEDMFSRIPDAARRDMEEWREFYNSGAPEDMIQRVLGSEIPLAELLHDDRRITITDDRPFNEYFFLRRTRDKMRNAYLELLCIPPDNFANPD